MKHPFFIFCLIAALPLAAVGQDKKSVADLTKQARKAVDGQKDEEALNLIREISAIPGEEAMKALFDLGMRAQTKKVIQAVTGLLAAKGDDEALKYYEEEAKSSVDDRRIYLTDILSEMKSPRAVEVLAVMADERNERILRSVIAALGKQKVRGSVEPLLKILERFETNRDRGQVYQEVRDALFELTSQDFDVLVDWRKWWDVNREKFEPGKKSEGATQARKPVRDATPEFAGRKIFGKNVVFVIDTSGTMQYVMKDDIPGLSRADGTDKAGRVQDADEQITKENSRLAKFWTRMEMAKRALIKAVAAFDAKARINVLEFNTKVKRFEKNLFPASPGMKKKATDWVRKMKWIPNGYTYTQLALEEAFADKNATEIYFLSDGIPSKDGTRNDPTEPILEKVEVLNRFRKVKIHTFGYDPLNITEGLENNDLLKANNFLKKLAKTTGGTFTLLKVTDEQPPKGYNQN